MILHLALPDDWRRALVTGTYEMSTRGLTIAEVGFLHGARDEAQAAGVRARFYADVPELVVLALDEEALRAAGFDVRYEPGDPASELFPHVYGGPVPTHVMSPVPQE